MKHVFHLKSWMNNSLRFEHESQFYFQANDEGGLVPLIEVMSKPELCWAKIESAMSWMSLERPSSSKVIVSDSMEFLFPAQELKEALLTLSWPSASTPSSPSSLFPSKEEGAAAVPVTTATPTIKTYQWLIRHDFKFIPLPAKESKCVL